MVLDAEAHAADDAAEKEKVEKHNALDSMIYQAEKMLQENESKLSESDSAGVRAAVDEAKKDLESGDVAKLDAARQRVEQELHSVAEALYKAKTDEEAAGQADADSAAGGPPAEEEGDVVDAEYTEETRDN
jgi:molecular chaperone DnaK